MASHSAISIKHNAKHNVHLAIQHALIVKAQNGVAALLVSSGTPKMVILETKFQIISKRLGLSLFLSPSRVNKEFPYPILWRYLF